ncbi:hypothetical protein AAFC00_003580 [Neodothiora populina]|uniref:Uncharacterized protein n=1 Tax=Neodothiora populina TaxID=2781224 RepID=A0ABR3PF56_9PEZI
MDCFPDFCLACDKQTSDGLYCSQACRLADLESAGSSAPASPSYSVEQEQWQSQGSSARNSIISLPQAFYFNSIKTLSETSSLESSETQVRKVLSPSSSRSSMSSAISNAGTQTSAAVSQQAQHELQGYVSSFDAIREMKRRSLSSNSGY